MKINHFQKIKGGPPISPSLPLSLSHYTVNLNPPPGVVTPKSFGINVGALRCRSMLMASISASIFPSVCHFYICSINPSRRSLPLRLPHSLFALLTQTLLVALTVTLKWLALQTSITQETAYRVVTM